MHGTNLDHIHELLHYYPLDAIPPTQNKTWAYSMLNPSSPKKLILCIFLIKSSNPSLPELELVLLGKGVLLTGEALSLLEFEVEVGVEVEG